MDKKQTNITITSIFYELYKKIREEHKFKTTPEAKDFIVERIKKRLQDNNLTEHSNAVAIIDYVNAFELDKHALINKTIINPPDSDVFSKKEIKVISDVFAELLPDYSFFDNTLAESTELQIVKSIENFIAQINFKGELLALDKEGRLTPDIFETKKMKYIDSLCKYLSDRNFTNKIKNTSSLAQFIASAYFLTIDENNELYTYDFEKKIYVPITNQFITDILTDIPIVKPTASEISAKLGELSTIVRRSVIKKDRYVPKKLDIINEDWVFFNNIILDLKTKTTLNYSPTIFATRKVDCYYDEQAENYALANTKNALTIIKEICDDNEDRFKALLQILVRCLRGVNFTDTIINFVGVGGTGKSTITNIIKYLVGDKNIAYIGLDQFSKDVYLTGIKDKFLSLGQDAIDGKYIGDTRNLKSLSSSDTITVDVKYKDPIQVTFPGLIIQSTPELLSINDAAGQMTRRLKPIVFGRSFKDDPIEDLSHYLKNPKTLAYLVKYLVDHYDELSGPFVSPDIDLIEELQAMNDPMYRACEFIKDTYPNLLDCDYVPMALVKAAYDDSQGVSVLSDKKKSPKSFYSAFSSYAPNINMTTDTKKVKFSQDKVLSLLTNKSEDEILEGYSPKDLLPDRSNILAFIENIKQSTAFSCYTHK